MGSPLLQDSYSPVSAEALKSFEREHGVKLPDEYKRFLEAHNGGSFDDDDVVFDRGGGDIIAFADFYALDAPFRYADLSTHYRLFQQAGVPASLLPIADDGMGNPICLSLSAYGAPLSLWDHETGEVSDVASGIDELLRGIRYDDGKVWLETAQPFMAAERGDLKAIAAIPDDQLDRRNNRGLTMLACASRSSRPDVVDVLLRRGADVNSRAPDGRTPLIFAARRQAYDVCRLLAEHGAELDIQDKNGASALMESVSTSIRIAQFLIESGADVDLRDKYGNNALSLCLDKENRRFLSALIDRRSERDKP